MVWSITVVTDQSDTYDPLIMSEVEEVSNLKERLLAAHRKQKKDLQNKIQAIKKAIPNGNKARAKEARKTIETLQNELALKQTNELDELNHKLENDVSAVVDDLSSKSAEIEPCEDNVDLQPVKISKAQKRRNKKAAKAKELSLKVDEAEANYCNTARYQEEITIKNILKERNLTIKGIKPDGDCLYSAVKDQLRLTQHDKLSIDELRGKTASYMRTHAEDFIPFLTNQNSGNMFTQEEFANYCMEIEKPSTWGGQLELLALSRVLNIPIHVIQASGPVTILGEEYKTNIIILTFHRHEFGLGQHYNSVREAVNEAEVDS